MDMRITPAFFLTPVFDGKVIPVNPRAALKNGDFTPVKLLFGFNANEGSIFIWPTILPAEEGYRALATRCLGYASMRKYLEKYPTGKEHSPLARVR
jgi:carboxylesterase type B